MTQDEKRFFVLLTQLSKMTRFELDESLVELYDKALSPFGYARINRALELKLSDIGSRDPFPSIREIKSVIEESLAPEDAGPMIAGRILEAVARIGPYQTEKFRAHVGEVGWRIVQMSGGLEPVCSIQDKDVGTHRGQWSRLATSLLRAGAAALPESPKHAELDGPKPEKELKSIADIISRIPK